MLRKEKGLSQENIAETIGVSRQSVAKWEAGLSYPDIGKLIQISTLYKVSIDKLVKNLDANCNLPNEVKHAEDLSNEEIFSFLCSAKKFTYAGKGAEALSSRPRSHDLHYEDGRLKYIDTYIGSERFAGEEALWVDDIPFWSMNYMGRVIADGFSGDFLREALSHVPKENPYRGPMVYQNGEYKYHCIISGSFYWFNGYEEIFYNNVKTYECVFHGGCIK